MAAVCRSVTPSGRATVAAPPPAPVLLPSASQRSLPFRRLPFPFASPTAAALADTITSALLLLSVWTSGRTAAAVAADWPTPTHSTAHTHSVSPLSAARPNMRRTAIREAATLLLSVALLLASGAVQRAAAVPFAALSPQPVLRLEGFYSCVLSASGRNISSVTSADLAQYHNSISRCSGGVAVNAVDLRSATAATAHCAQRRPQGQGQGQGRGQGQGQGQRQRQGRGQGRVCWSSAPRDSRAEKKNSPSSTDDQSALIDPA